MSTIKYITVEIATASAKYILKCLHCDMWYCNCMIKCILFTSKYASLITKMYVHLNIIIYKILYKYIYIYIYISYIYTNMYILLRWSITESWLNNRYGPKVGRLFWSSRADKHTDKEKTTWTLITMQKKSICFQNKNLNEKTVFHEWVNNILFLCKN